jgi:hypothetical protein
MDINIENAELELRKLLQLNNASLVRFSDDNSFPLFLQEFIKLLFKNIIEASEDKELSEYKNIKNDLTRFFTTTYNGASIKILDNQLLMFYDNFLTLLGNWFAMIKQGDLFSFFNISKNELDEFEKSINEISDILRLNGTIDNLLGIVDRLLRKAEKVLAASPSNFKISDHFFTALKRESNDIDH